MKLPALRFALPAFLFLLVIGGSAFAEKKSIAYTNKMGPVLTRTVVALGDQPNHELTQMVRQDMTRSSDPDWEGVPAVNNGQSDLIDGSGAVYGYTTRTHKNGDKTFYKYQGTINAIGAGTQRQTTGQGTVELIGGTGKFANARGSGTWSSEAGGQATIKIDLEY